MRSSVLPRSLQRVGNGAAPLWVCPARGQPRGRAPFVVSVTLAGWRIVSRIDFIMAVTGT